MKNIKILAFLLILTLASCSTKNETTKLEQIITTFHDHSSKNILIAAHRAMHTIYPENSLSAIQHSIDSGVDIIEIDVRTTKDGEIVLMHDKTIDRTTTGKGNLDEITYKELKKLELRKKDNDGKKYYVPLAKDAFKLAYGNIMIDLDIKDVSIKNLVELVHNAKIENQVFFFDSEYAVLDSVLLIDSTLMVMPRAYSHEDVKNVIKKYHPPVVHISRDFYTDEVVKTIINGNARIWVNALGKADNEAIKGDYSNGYVLLVKGGANIIQTDYPVLLNEYIVDSKVHL